MACFPDVWAPKLLSYVTAYASIVLCIIIAIGNALIILAVIFDPLKKLRTPFTYFLINLAVSDLIVGLITMPVSYNVHMEETTGYIHPNKVTLIHLSYFISSTASVFSLAALTVDRFVAIKWPILYRNRLSVLRCVCISIAIWVFSAALSTIYLATGYIDHLMVFAHVAVLITMILLVFTYRAVYKALRRQSLTLRAFQCTVKFNRSKERKNGHHKNIAANEVNQNSPWKDDLTRINDMKCNTPTREMGQMEYRRVRLEKKVTRAFLYILGLFIACYLPAIIMIYILKFCETCNCDFRHILRDLQFLLVSANSAMNPLVCTIRLGQFRRSIIALFTCKKTQRSKYMFGGNGKHIADNTLSTSSGSQPSPKTNHAFEMATT